MGLSLRPDHIRRYGEIAKLLLKYGRSDLLFHAGLSADELPSEPPGDNVAGDHLAHDLCLAEMAQRPAGETTHG